MWSPFSSVLSPPESGGPFIDQVYILQGYAEGWKEGAWEEKIDSRPCIEPPLYSQDKHEYYRYLWEAHGHGPRPGRLLLPHLGTQAVQKYPFPLLMHLNLVVEMAPSQAALLSEVRPGEVLSLFSSLCSLHSPLSHLPQQRTRVMWF